MLFYLSALQLFAVLRVAYAKYEVNISLRIQFSENRLEVLHAIQPAIIITRANSAHQSSSTKT
jgi:hypothetical protein